MPLPGAPFQCLDGCLMLREGVNRFLSCGRLPNAHHVVIPPGCQHPFGVVVQATHQVRMCRHSGHQVLSNSNIMLMNFCICTSTAQHVLMPSKGSNAT
eukprot:Skav218270  [mRNA]  locus=scaffold2035:279559:279852:- [translate_table: standard]